MRYCLLRVLYLSMDSTEGLPTVNIMLLPSVLYLSLDSSEGHTVDVPLAGCTVDVPLAECTVFKHGK